MTSATNFDPAALAPESALLELSELYAEVDASVAIHQPRCEVSGRCCRFREFDHTLFLSRPEAELLLAQGLPPGAVVDSASCPFQINGLCTARDRRPLGCRLFYCDPAYSDAMVQLSEWAVQRLKQWHRDHQRAWDYRPLFDYLSEYQQQPTPESRFSESTL